MTELFNAQRNPVQPCVSQKSRKLFGPVKFSGVISGLRKVFPKTSKRNPRFSGMFFGNVPLRLREFISSRMNANSRWIRVELVIIVVDVLK